jgi:hypothetical protein
MCRLLGHVTRTPTALAGLLGEAGLWTSLENGEILIVRRDTLDVSVRLVTDARVAR